MTVKRRFFRPGPVPGIGRRDASSADAAARDRAERFRQSILPHLDAAYGFARYLSRNPDAAEDIVQTAFLRALRSFDGFHGDAAKPWLFAIVRNCFLDWMKRDRADRPAALCDTGDPAPRPPAIAVDDETPETILARHGEVQMLRMCIDDLPQPFRETLVLRELEQFSYKEISMIAAVPIGTVMSRLARARQMLSELLLPRVDPDRRTR